MQCYYSFAKHSASSGYYFCHNPIIRIKYYSFPLMVKNVFSTWLNNGKKRFQAIKHKSNQEFVPFILRKKILLLIAMSNRTDKRKRQKIKLLNQCISFYCYKFACLLNVSKHSRSLRCCFMFVST